MKVFYFILWALLAVGETARLRERRRDLPAFWVLAVLALAAGAVWAALPDGAGLAEWLTESAR